MRLFSCPVVASIALALAALGAAPRAAADPVCQADGFHAIGTGGTVRDCTPYVCAAAGGCLRACALDADCTKNARCDVAKSQCAVRASCGADGISSIDVTGATKACAPFRCGADGQCLDICASSTDCASGNVCDPKTSACLSSCSKDSDCPSAALCGTGGYCDGRAPATGCTLAPTASSAPRCAPLSLAIGVAALASGARGRRRRSRTG